MVKCSCGKPLDKVPDWLMQVNVQFICNNCPNRDYQNIAHAKFPPEAPKPDPEVETELILDDEEEQE